MNLSYRFTAALASTLFCAVPAMAQESSGAVTVRVDPSIRHGIWEGWGTSLAWWAKALGDRDDIADLLFTTKQVDFNGQRLPGLGMNIVRYNAGACSWNEFDGRRMRVSKTIKPFRQIEGFWLDGKSADPTSNSWDWTVDANQRAMLTKARDRGADRFELFSNSPMWWMCANDNPSGSPTGRTDNLPADNYPAFATYLATIAAHAKAHWGITFTTVEPFNEPRLNVWAENFRQEGCHFTLEAQAAFLPMLRAELDRQGLADMPIAASDDNEYDQAVETWAFFPPAVRAIVSQVNVHGYQGVRGRRHLLHQAVVVEAGKCIWNSEHGDDRGDGIELARVLTRDLRWLRAVAWCYWQPFDGGNNGGWGFFGANLDDLARPTIAHANPKYFVFAQYARHVRPGMTILESGHDGTVVAHDPVGRRFIVVVFNEGSAARRVSIDLRALAAPDGPVRSFLTHPAGAVHYAAQPDLPLVDGRFAVDMPADAVRTFEVDDVGLR